MDRVACFQEMSYPEMDKRRRVQRVELVSWVY